MSTVEELLKQNLASYLSLIQVNEHLLEKIAEHRKEQDRIEAEAIAELPQWKARVEEIKAELARLNQH